MVGTTPHVETVIRDYIAKMASQITLEKVILFGSRATQKALHTSDVDLAIISPNFERMGWIQRLEFLSLNWYYDVPGECFGYTPSEFEAGKDDPPGFISQIHKYGLMLYPGAGETPLEREGTRARLFIKNDGSTANSMLPRKE